jgi:hypothetical protein
MAAFCGQSELFSSVGGDFLYQLFTYVSWSGMTLLVLLCDSVLAGGLKIWECTRDMADFLIHEGINFTGKQVLDLGCGTGLLGILAIYLEAKSVHFHDYVSEGCVCLGGGLIP